MRAPLTSRHINRGPPLPKTSCSSTNLTPVACGALIFLTRLTRQIYLFVPPTLSTHKCVPLYSLKYMSDFIYIGDNLRENFSQRSEKTNSENRFLPGPFLRVAGNRLPLSRGQGFEGGAHAPGGDSGAGGGPIRSRKRLARLCRVGPRAVRRLQTAPPSPGSTIHIRLTPGRPLDQEF